MEASYASDYEKLYHHHWWWRARSKFVNQWLDALALPTSGQVLDIGCGGGWGFDRWQKYGEVWGVEASQALVDSAGDNASHIHCGNFDRDFRPNRRFTLILMLDVLEHMAQPQAALEYAYELLEPAGRILITVPAMPSLWTSHDELNHHYVRYTKSSLQSVVKESGIQVDQINFFFRWITLAKLLIRFKESLIATEPHNPTLPSARLNQLFYGLAVGEQKLLGRVRLPFGTSLVCVGRKPKSATA